GPPSRSSRHRDARPQSRRVAPASQTSSLRKTGREACPTSPNQDLGGRVGQASRPVQRLSSAVKACAAPLPHPIPPRHPSAEFREGLYIPRRTRMIGPQPQRIRRKTIRQGDVEFFQRLHLPIEPALRVRTKAI